MFRWICAFYAYFKRNMNMSHFFWGSATYTGVMKSWLFQKARPVHWSPVRTLSSLSFWRQSLCEVRQKIGRDLFVAARQYYGRYPRAGTQCFMKIFAIFVTVVFFVGITCFSFESLCITTIMYLFPPSFFGNVPSMSMTTKSRRPAGGNRRIFSGSRSLDDSVCTSGT